MVIHDSPYSIKLRSQLYTQCAFVRSNARRELLLSRIEDACRRAAVGDQDAGASLGTHVRLPVMSLVLGEI